MIVCSVFYLGCATYFYVLIDTGVFPTLPDEHSQWSFQMGVLTGYVGGKLGYFAVFGLILGVYVLLARRKDRLLAMYYHRLTELGELDGGRPTWLGC